MFKSCEDLQVEKRMARERAERLAAKGFSEELAIEALEGEGRRRISPKNKRAGDSGPER